MFLSNNFECYLETRILMCTQSVPYQYSHDAFDALIQVLIERVSAVGGDDDVKGGVELLHRRLADELAADAVGREQVTGEDSGDLPPLVQGHVQQEARAGAQGDVAHLFPDGIPLSDAERGIGIIEIAGAVIAHDRAQAGHAGHNALGAATEAREEVRLNEPRDDTDIGFDEVTVEQGGCAVTRCAQGN